MVKDQKLEAKPNPLEVHKDTVNFDLSGNLPAKLLKKGTVFTVNPSTSMAITNWHCRNPIHS